MNGTRADRPIPSQSRAYTEALRRPAHRARDGKFRKKNPRPAPYPWRITAGGGDAAVGGEVGVIERVLI